MSGRGLSKTLAAERGPGDSLWLLVLAPAIWMLHFLLSYITAAVGCAKAIDPDSGLHGPRIAVAVYTLLALSGIVLVSLHAWRRHRAGAGNARSHARALDSRRFLGFTAWLLCGLSLVATLYVALPILFIKSCH